MNLYHQKAIELKYQGLTYAEISETIGGKIKAERLRHLFANDGTLHLEYLRYESKMNAFKEDETKESFKHDLTIAPTLMRGMLQRALKRHDDRLAFQILREQMDRAGFVVTRSVAVDRHKEDQRKPQSYEEFCETCRLQEIDPNTGCRVEPGDLVV